MAAIQIVKALYTVTSLSCTFALSPLCLSALLQLCASPSFTSLHLVGSRCEIANTLADTMLRMPKGSAMTQLSVTEMTLAHCWTGDTSSRRVLEALQHCGKLTCDPSQSTLYCPVLILDRSAVLLVELASTADEHLRGAAAMSMF